MATDPRKGTCNDPEVAARRSDNPIVAKIQEGLCEAFSATMAPSPIAAALSPAEPKVEARQQPTPPPAGPTR
jgi:hypothetical protein